LEFPVDLINYNGNPINLGTLEGTVRIYGYIDLPPNFSGKLLEVKVKYNVLEEEEIKKELYITTASSKEDFVQSIDQDIVAEGMWCYNLRNLSEHNLNRTINVPKNIAESTKRLDLLECTRKLADSKAKRLNSEVTKRLRK
jgi:hypothetical protein